MARRDIIETKRIVRVKRLFQGLNWIDARQVGIIYYLDAALSFWQPTVLRGKMAFFLGGEV